jgi:hypothetical protein
MILQNNTVKLIRWETSNRKKMQQHDKKTPKNTLSEPTNLRKTSKHDLSTKINNIIHDCENTYSTLQTDDMCTCVVENKNIAYQSGGCLKCTSQDCAYYIQNFIETILIFHNTSR